METKIFIFKIDWLEENEAIVEFKINQNSYFGFCHPCSLVESNEYIVFIDFLETKISHEVIINENKQKKKKLSRNNESTSYVCYGEIISINPLIIDCGDIKFRMHNNFDNGRLNKNRYLNSFVYFSIERLDIHQH